MNLAGIRKVVGAVKTIPVIGNGDIITPEAAKKMFDETGCAGVSIGRGAFYDPWIFQRTLEFLKSGTGFQPVSVLDFRDRLEAWPTRNNPPSRSASPSVRARMPFPSRMKS